MRFKVVFFEDLQKFKNPKIINDVFRNGYYLQDNNFVITGNYIENRTREKINTSL